MTNPTSNFGWQMPTPTDLVTDLPADFEVFGQAVDTSLADLQGGTTGQILAKATNADMDFAWITNDVGDITAVNVTAPITGGGSSGAVTIGINAATTSVVGAVQLSDSTSTTSSVLASTPTATKSAYDLADTANTAAGAAQTTANAAVPKSTVTTAGDVIYATGSAAVTRLGIGTAGQVLQVNSGATAPEWTTLSAGNYTGVAVFADNVSTALVANVSQILNFTSESFDTDSFHSNVTNTSRITIPSGKTGKYQIDVYYRLGIGVGYAVAVVKKNGTNITSGISNGEVAGQRGLGSNTPTLGNAFTIELTAGDYIEMAVQSDQTTTTGIFARFSATFLGA
jgi:hypothetical protein